MFLRLLVKTINAFLNMCFWSSWYIWFVRYGADDSRPCILAQAKSEINVCPQPVPFIRFLVPVRPSRFHLNHPSLPGPPKSKANSTQCKCISSSHDRNSIPTALLPLSPHARPLTSFPLSLSRFPPHPYAQTPSSPRPLLQISPSIAAPHLPHPSSP